MTVLCRNLNFSYKNWTLTCGIFATFEHLMIILFFHSHGIFVNTSEKWTKDNFDSCWSPLKYQTSFFLFQNKLHNIAIAQLVNVLGVIIYNNIINCNKIYIHTDSKNLYSWTYFECWHLQYFMYIFVVTCLDWHFCQLS